MNPAGTASSLWVPEELRRTAVRPPKTSAKAAEDPSLKRQPRRGVLALAERCSATLLTEDVPLQGSRLIGLLSWWHSKPVTEAEAKIPPDLS